MSKSLTKSRFFYTDLGANPGKIKRLETLHAEYVSYARLCVKTMIDGRRLSIAKSEFQSFFPKALKLTSQIQKNARAHAVSEVSKWAKSRYKLKIKGLISKAKREGGIPEDTAKSLYTIGKYLRDKPDSKGVVTRKSLDLYWSLLDKKGGRKPEIKDNFPMRLSEATAGLQNPKKSVQHDFWLRVSSLESYKSIWLPLVGNSYITKAGQVSKGILARKTKKGRWRFEAVDKTKDWEAPEPSDLPEDAPRLGVDVGLNVLAAASDGVLYGASFKPKFDRAHKAVRNLRANRQRQGLKENSPRLDRLEQKLSGMIKTETGRISNDLVKRHPDTVFVLEDLDLRGCKGQKRFAYRALAKALETKAPVEVVNPAYTSQECPSCGHISRSNRSGTKFHCRSCGRKAHADWVGASGILRRSGDNDIGCGDRPDSVKATLQRRYLLRRSSPASSRSSRPTAPSPLGPSLTTEVLVQSGIGTGSNLVPHYAK